MSRTLEKRLHLPARPEQVWAAIATGQGIASWFVPHDVAPHVGGAVVEHFGGDSEITGRVTVWEPARRFAYGSAQPQPEGPNYVFAYELEGHPDGSTELRFVQSGFLDGPAWDAEYATFDTGWDLFFHNLASYFERFAGLPVSNVVTSTYAPGTADAAWPVLRHGLGIATPPAVGERITLAPRGMAAIPGVVDVASCAVLGVRSEHGLHRIAAEGDAGCAVSAYHYFYGIPVDTAALTAGWQAWLDGLFPAVTGAPSAPGA